ncbi:MAG: hypothetical protein ACOX37_07975 [Bacillota bacterium]
MVITVDQKFVVRWIKYSLTFGVRGGTQEFKEYVLSDEGYVDQNGKPADENADFKMKSRVIAKEINVTLPSGKKTRKTVYEKQVVFWEENML